ncbi:uracil-xanthine permease family protein [Alkalibacillus salilacus]|uniref:Uracil permease n=1 Tax=Alkalibacillus salilacus TaxID=284582 RepID=A0ABT9VDX2_9BACI|nr:solute carrier family 23 protein [Alkalibacillus salilacus]MDQ0159162.1 uracil permease [Alkalibacillus salilacus]
MSEQEKVLDVRDVPNKAKWFWLSLQHLFAMFGATILVPFLVEMPANVALVTSGIGTLAYLVITRGQIPAYLGSSFAFIAPIQAASVADGLPGAMVGAFLAGLVYGLVAMLIKVSGVNWLLKLLPPVVVGPVIMVIGLGLAPTAIDMAMYNSDGNIHFTYMLVALITLLITVIGSVYFKGFFNVIPILLGIVGGYLTALIVGIVQTDGIQSSFQALTSSSSFGEMLNAVFVVPDFIIPFVDYQPLDVLSLSVVFIMVPVALVTITEHIGDQMVLSKVAERNFLKSPGLGSSILGDGVATMIASVLGGPPNTTYGENIGVLAITRVFSVFVIAGAAVLAILFGFIDIIAVLIESIPEAVMGGVSILLFGVIASSGMRMLIDNHVDLGVKRNLIITSVILVIGIGGVAIPVSEQVEIPGLAVATIVGIILNSILPGGENARGNGQLFEDES